MDVARHLFGNPRLRSKKDESDEKPKPKAVTQGSSTSLLGRSLSQSQTETKMTKTLMTSDLNGELILDKIKREIDNKGLEENEEMVYTMVQTTSDLNGKFVHGKAIRETSKGRETITYHVNDFGKIDEHKQYTPYRHVGDKWLQNIKDMFYW